MNNLKRITALTVLCFMLCSFLTCAGISENEKVFASDGENYDENGTELLSVLGISADIKNSDAVTRGEFAELLGKALKCDGEFLPDEDPFKDVYNYDLKSGYIYALKQLGVVCGDENGRFNKNREITFEEACMMSLRALNYKNQLSDPRVFSYQLARNVGLTKGTGLSSGDVLSEDNALLVVFNMLNCDIPHLTSIEDGYADYNIISGITLLGEIWELYKTEGILRKTRVTDLYTLSDIAEEGYIKIGETVFHDNSGFSKDMLGRNVICYANADNEAAYIYSSKNSYMNISEDGEPSIDGFKISYYKGSRKTDVTLSAKYTVIYNGRVLESKLSGKLKENSSLKLVDNDRDGKYDVVFITERTYGVLKNVADDGSGKIVFADLNGSLNNAEINDAAYDYAELYLNGSPCEVSDFKEGLVISREISNDGKCVKIYASDLKAGGTIEKISEKNGKAYYKTENGEYEASSYFVKYYGGKITPGSRTEIYLSDDGKAVYASDGAEIYSYGYVMAAAYEKKGIDKKLLVKLLTQSGDKNKYAVADKIVLDGKSVQRESAAVKNVFLPDGKNPYQVIKYSLNSEGEISKVDSESSNSASEKYSDNTDQNDSLLKYMSKRSIKYKTMGFFTPYAMISAGTAFFVVPKEIGTALEKSSYSDDYFDVGSLTYLPGDRVQTVDIFDIDKSGYAKAVVVYKDAKEKEIGDLSGYALVDSIETVKDIDGAESKAIYYWNDGAFYSATFKSDAASKADGLKPGDFIRMELDSKGRISNISIDYSFENNTFGSNLTGDDAYTQHTECRAYKVNGSTIFADINGEIQIIPSENAKYVIFDTVKKTIRPGTIHDIKDIAGFGSQEASKLFIVRRYSSALICVIYR